MFFCNGVGSQTEIVFDGNSLVFDKEANLCGMLASFKEDLQSFILHDDGMVEGNIIQVADLVPDRQLNP